MVSISKLLSGQNILIGLVVVILIGGIYVYTSNKSFSRDAMTSGEIGSNSGSGSYASVGGSSMGGVAGLPQPKAGASKQVGMTANGEPSLRNSAAQNVVQPKAGAAKDVANPSELLPASGGTSWAKLNPNADTNKVIIPDLLEAGYHIGLDTIGQTLKNPNLQERSEPIIPKQAVSPWNNSSYEPDIARVPLEIGYGCN
jgi:hypothetical protein